jgi:hypothetical protein
MPDQPPSSDLRATLREACLQPLNAADALQAVSPTGERALDMAQRCEEEAQRLRKQGDLWMG